MLFQEDGDDPAQYDSRAVLYDEKFGGYRYVLKTKPGGGCVYLQEGGCAIYDRRPVVCRAFDCREFYKNLGSRLKRERAIAKDGVSRAIVQRGYELIRDGKRVHMGRQSQNE